MAKADKCNWTFANAAPSTFMVNFIEAVFDKIMAKASASDRNTFKLSLMHVESCISKNFNRHVMQAGWQKAGLIDLDFHKVMSHWLGYERLPCDAVNGLVGMLPPFLYEMGTSFALTDKSMQAMQQYFPKDFKIYPTDRSALGFPRQRASLMSWAVEALAARAAQNVEVDPRLLDEVRPVGPQLDPKGLAKCPCALGKFHGKHYADTDEGWARHILTQPHKNWRAEQLGIADNSAEQAVVMTAAAMEWFQQESTAKLKLMCQSLNLSASIGKKFVEKKVQDSELTWLFHHSEARLLSDFGLAAGQVVLMRLFIAQHAELSQPALNPVAVMARVDLSANIHHPPPQAWLASPAAAPLAAPPPPPPAAVQAPIPPQPRGFGGKFTKKQKNQ